MADTFVKIRIGSEADLAALKAAGLEIRNVETAAGKAAGVLATFGQGFGQGIGQEVLRSLAQIPQFLADAAQRGIAFNATLDDSQKGIANLIARFNGLDKAAAANAAGGVIEAITKLEPKTAGTLGTLIEGFQVALSASQSTGLSLEENVGIVGKFANAMDNLTIPLEQFRQEVGSILQGTIGGDSVLAKKLGITNPEVQAAKEAGKLLDYFEQKIGKLGESSDTFAVATSTVKSNLDKLLGTVTKPFYDDLKVGIEQVNAAFADPKAQQQIAGWAQLIRGAFEIVKNGVTNGARLAEATFDPLGLGRRAAGAVGDFVRGQAPQSEAPKTVDLTSKAIGDNTAEAEKNQKAWLALGDAISGANSELEKAEAKFAESGQTPEAALQANIAKLNAVRADLAAQTGLGANADAGEFQAAGLAQGLPAVLEQTRILLELNTAINEQAGEISKTNAEALQAEDKRTAAARTYLADLETQLKIERARLDGNADLVTNLEAQRDLAGQLARIQSAELTPGEKERAADLATQTSELQRQITLKEQLNALQEAEADINVARAKATGRQREIDAAEVTKLRGDKERELRAQGIPADRARKLADDLGEAETRTRLRARGRIGGSATRSAADEIGTDLGSRPSDDFLSLRRKAAGQPIGELLGPPAPGAAPGAPGSGASGAAQLSSAAGGLDQAGNSVETAAAAIETAASGLSAAANRLGSAADSLDGAISDLDARVSSLESAAGY